MNSPASQQLFVYSSLREGFHQRTFDYVTRFFNFVSPAKVKGILSDLESRPVATPTSENSFIKGELYKLKKEDGFSWAFGQFDDYEGLDAEEGEQPLYRRELTIVYKDDGSVTSAWIYWYNGDVSEMPVIHSGDALEYQSQKNLNAINP